MSLETVIANARALFTSRPSNGTRAELTPLPDAQRPGDWTQGPYFRDNPTDPPYRQPIYPLSQPGNYRRYEYFQTPVLASSFPAVLVPPGTIWRIVSATLVYTSDAAAANRYMTMGIWPDGGGIGVSFASVRSGSDLVMVAAQSIQHCWMAGATSHVPSTTAASNQLTGHGGLPEHCIVYENTKLQFFASGFQPGDLIEHIEIYAEEWISYTK